ncbi:MAG TPA: M48 family metallopeptidase [Terriglobales bacterium]|nr:M48 family metallopeptidase [Terriglobales bacterium]
MTRRTISARILAIFLTALIAMPVWLWAVTPGPELPNPGQVGLSKEQQEQLGLKAVAEVYKQMPVLPDSSPVTQYVQSLGKKLVKVIPSQYSWPYQFHVIEQKEINAFALPGGPIFVNVGTITQADNEAELAGVIAHEMSHVYMQHSAKQMHQNTLPSILAGLGQIAGSVIGGIGGAIANIGGQMAGGVLSMKYSRGDEAQADAVGAIIMYKVGYNPKAMADFFQKLEKEGGGAGPQFLSDHPNPGNRVEAVDKEIQNWPPKQYQQNSPQFVQAKQKAQQVKAYTAQQIADGAKSGQWARQNTQAGAVPSAEAQAAANQTAAGGSLTNVSYQQVRPSGNFTQLQQSGLSISYPDNWKAAGGQNGITIAPPAGVGQNAIAYGVVISQAQDSNANSLDQATQDLIRNLQQSNQLQVSGGARNISVNGTRGRSVYLNGQSPVQQNGQPEQERDWLVTLPGSQGSILYLIFIAPESQFKQLQPTYEKMLNSLQLQ